MTMIEKTDHVLDITGDVCPMTFVRTRLLIEKMQSGETAEIMLRGEEPLGNVPDSVRELGHIVASMTPLPGEPKDGTHRLIIQKI